MVCGIFHLNVGWLGETLALTLILLTTWIFCEVCLKNKKYQTLSYRLLGYGVMKESHYLLGHFLSYFSNFF